MRSLENINIDHFSFLFDGFSKDEIENTDLLAFFDDIFYFFVDLNLPLPSIYILYLNNIYFLEKRKGE